MIVILGDLHGAFGLGIGLAAKAKMLAITRESVPVLQVGDLGWDPQRPPMKAPWPIHFLEGNHDHLPSLLAYPEPTEVAPNWIYCPRGSILELGGKRIGFLGGARSIDRLYRVRGETWWDEEECSAEEAQRLEGQRLDLLVTHSPPASVVRQMGYDDADHSSHVVQDTWETLGQPPLYCGHMHRRYVSGNVTVLGDMDIEIIY